jgi:Domain of Unknown Function (DUF748)
MRPATKIIIWGAGILGLVLLLAFAAAFFIDEPLRRRMEANMNRSLKGYHVELPHLDFNPIGFSVSLKNLTLIQDAHPDPPVGRIERLKASVDWFALLRGKLVADFELERPDFHINLIQLRREAAEKVPIEERGWQEAVYAIYPLKVNLLTIHNGKFTYIDEDPRKPLVLSQIFLQASNIRNVYSPDRVYPSPFRFTAQIFEKGKAEIEGSANFLAEPHPGLEAELNLREIDLAYFRPILADHHLTVTGGWLAAQGRMEYAPQIKTVHLKSARIDRVKIDLVHAAQTAKVEKAKAEKAKRAAKSVTDQPGLLLRIDDFRLTGEVGFQNKAQDPSYRLFLQQANLHLTNLSNQFREGIAEARLTGHFMGSGQTEVLARFRPEKKGPDFDLHVRVVGTQVKAMNDLLRAHGNFDVTEGQFSLFMEMHVRNQRAEGYVKPFFENMNVYDPGQDQEKPLFRKLYEGVIDRIAELLKNEATEQVATKADISGQIENPEANTWQIIANLVQNAFVQIILPGFESEVQPRKRKTN